MKKICVVTGTRAEYGLLKPVIDKIYRSNELELQLIVTGMHLSTEFGLTYREIEEDGYPITSKVEMLLGSDTPVGITKSMGVALIGFADCIAVSKPDMMVILGDRYEIFTAAAAAMVAGVPIAHIHGGELTEGIMDEAIRHSVTKMSYLHFTANEEYRKRVIQLGEAPQRVFNVGALGVENAKNEKLMSRREVEETLNFKFGLTTIMVTYHPVTLDEDDCEIQFQRLLNVIDRHKEISIIFTKANADTDGRIINQMIDEYVYKNKDRCEGYNSLGRVKYLSALQFCDAVVGNSSSGIIEVPTFGIPTVNIGSRQKGRVRAASVIDCGNEEEQIEEALMKALSPEFRKSIASMKNPYEGMKTSDTIIEIIEEAVRNRIELQKQFFNLEVMQ